MRKDHRPWWLRQLSDRGNRWYVDTFIRPQFDSAGAGLRVVGPRHLQISGPNISVGQHVHMMALPDKPVRLAVFEGMGEVHIGDYSLVNPGVRITSASSIRIGRSCMLAMNCYLTDADWHDVHHRIFAPGTTASIELGDNVWIGDSALVTKGVTIGENSIVGAWSVVTRDVPPNVIVAGNPARIVKELDTSNLTTRQHLFTGATSYEAFENDNIRQRLKGNTFAGWLRQLLLPGPEG